ncbi:MAG: ATP-dependent DNA helicase RecQ [Candidatus Marinimicrobia bacterium]|nr:ATP-dependent DNA helicase RecQ [Candidatus Neomarinimicrobiota bacterium]
MMLEEILQEQFGLPGFRPGQKDIIENILAGNDTIAIMATGGGKSLCYQFPGTQLPGLIIVITPIISLMADQVRRLHELNISAGYLSSAKSKEEQKKDLSELEKGHYKFILISPERLESKAFLKAIEKQKIGLLTVDEAHCISQWGHDFRPDYLNIGKFRKKTGFPPCIALTGTATERVEKEIAHFLRMTSSKTFKSSFNRSNLRYLVYQEKSTIDKLDKLRWLLEYLNGCGIIYCATRKEVEYISNILNKWELQCIPYHAGLDPDIRTLNQELWISGKIPLITATNAFGMGIDKPDVRFVIHFSMSSSMENYYQEAGRAGRDGDPSLCIALNSEEDERKVEIIQKLTDINPLHSDEHKKHLREMADSCEKYLKKNLCRRRLILDYFKEGYPPKNCKNCDICLKKMRHSDYSMLTFSSTENDTQVKHFRQYSRDETAVLLRENIPVKNIRNGVFDAENYLIRLLRSYGNENDAVKKALKLK